MAQLEDAFRTRELFLVAHDAVGEDGLIAGMSDVGIRPSARSRYERLKKALPHEGDVEWFRDGSRRGQQTAARVFSEVEWTQQDQLAPRGMGAWEGRNWSDVRREDSVRAEAFWSQYGRSRAPGDSESLQQVHDRVSAFLVGMGHRTTWSQAVLVVPPEIVGVAACAVMEVPLNTVLRLAVDPLSITRLRHTWIGWQLGCLNSKP